ncbi:uncharacterized protein LOC119354908 [Triticum dicoccoides]|uniref:uncharacterized protein LOC119354908 n=1 Tax=Triticum dicoccoides TaxID=85692 RepID=UPI00188DEBD6|nr:uncharacterized protein LOC119354908 [Triticum dicoccoides]
MCALLVLQLVSLLSKRLGLFCFVATFWTTGGRAAAAPRMAAMPWLLDDGIVRGMAIGAVFTDYSGKISCLEFHRKEDLLVTEDDSIRLYNTTSATMWMGSVWDLLHFDCWPIDMSDSVGFCCLGMLVGVQQH